VPFFWASRIKISTKLETNKLEAPYLQPYLGVDDSVAYALLLARPLLYVSSLAFSKLRI
jgi:hypothetical protein